MNIKDSFIHLGPGGNNKKALLKDFAITASGITLTRANLLIENNVEVDETLTLDIPIWNLSTTGNAATATKLYSTALTNAEDLNNLINTGVYGTTSASVCTSLINGPSGRSNGEARLEVIECAGSSGYLFQKYWARNTSGWLLYFRTKSGDYGWSSWIQNIDSGNYTNWVYTKTESDARFVLKAGDTMTGALVVPSLSVTGTATFSQTINGSILGNAATASRLQNARTIALTGSVTGSGTFDGSGNLSIATTTNHTHSYVNTIGKSGATITWSINGTAQTALDFSTTFAPYNADGYLPLSGGTMTGDITMTNGKAIIFTNYTTASIFDSVDRGIPFSFANAPAKIAYTCTDTDKGLTFNPNTGALKSGSFVKRGGTSSQFLKADGSVDSNSYLISSTNVTTATWTAKTDNVNYPIAFSPNETPATSGNGYNTGFTFNPGTKTFNNNGCRLQYDDTNKVLKFIFD